MLAGMASLFTTNFKLLRSRLDGMESNIVNAIEKKENQEIHALKF